MTGIFIRLLWNAHPSEIFHGNFFRLIFRHFLNPNRCERAIFQYRQMREEVEVLKTHANFTAY
ncbi:Uncharacterised protein [Vibrio cholerae]|nr:Uncharacterised protein [Vibrio cholerae]